MSGGGLKSGRAVDPTGVGSGRTQLCKVFREGGITDRGVGGGGGEGVQRRYGNSGEAGSGGVGV